MGRKRKILFEDTTYDRIGEPVNKDKCPECAEHPDCFACIEGKCTALSESGGQGCVFYKPEQQAIQEALRAYQVLKGKKRYDLIQKYIKALCSLKKDVLIEINTVLKSKNYTLIIKPHPLESIELIKSLDLSNILITTTQELQDKGISLYSLLAETDALISDYSSVIVDYLLLDKPIVMALSDLKEYGSNRGFVFDNIDDYMPGPVISDVTGLVNYIVNFDEINMMWENKRFEVKTKLHSYWDELSTKRVCDFFFGEQE